MTAAHRNGDPVIDWDEYEHFKGYRWNHNRIAAKLGVKPDSLRAALARRAVRERVAAEQTGVAA